MCIIVQSSVINYNKLIKEEHQQTFRFYLESNGFAGSFTLILPDVLPLPNLVPDFRKKTEKFEMGLIGKVWVE